MVALAVPRALALSAAALAAAWLGFYLIAPLPFIDTETFRATAVLHAATGLVFLPYLVSLVLGRRLPGGSVLDVPLVALLGVYLLTTATSLNWPVSLEVALTVLMALGVFFVLSDARLFRSWQVETAFVLAALAAAVKALWVVGGDYLDWLRLADAVRGGLSWGDLLPPTVPQVHGVGDGPSLLAAVLAMSLPFVLVAIFRPMKAALRALAVLAAAAIVLALFLTLARSAWLGAAAGVLTTALLVTATAAGRDLLRRLWPTTRTRRWLLGTLALAVVAVAAVGTAYLVQSVEARPLWLFHGSDTPRSDVMEAGTEMIRDYPLLGTGVGVYSLLYPQYSGQFPIDALHSHNGFLQAVVDLGVPGALALLAVVAALGWLLVRGLRETEGSARLSIAACAGAFVAFASFSLFDAPNGFKGPLVALAAVAAVAVLSAREGRRWAEAPLRLASYWRRLAWVGSMAARIVVPIAMVGLLVTWVRLDIGHYEYSSSVSNANVQGWPRALEQGQRAVDLDPQFAVYRLQLGAVQGQAYLETDSPQLLVDAVAQLGRGLELEPRSAVAHANLALLLAKAGDRGGARAQALAALDFANSDPMVVLAAGATLESTNWGEEAADAYALALVLDPDLANSPFWAGSPFRQTGFSDIVASSALMSSPCLSLRLAMESLSRDEALADCRRQVEAAPDDADGRVALAEALIDDGSLAEAFADLDYVLTRQPDNGPARTALGRWHDGQGAVVEARHQWLRAGQLGELEAWVLLGDSYPLDQVPAEVVEALRSELRRAEEERRLVSTLYYRSKFFRVSPETILLPGEWQQAVPGRIVRAEEALARWAGGADAP